METERALSGLRQCGSPSERSPSPGGCEGAKEGKKEGRRREEENRNIGERKRNDEAVRNDSNIIVMTRADDHDRSNVRGRATRAFTARLHPELYTGSG